MRIRQQHSWARVGQEYVAVPGTGPVQVDGTSMPSREVLIPSPSDFPLTLMGGSGRPGPMGEWYNEGGTCLLGRALTPLAVYDYVPAERAVRLRRVLDPDTLFGVYQDTGDEWLHVAGTHPDGGWGRLGMIKKGFYGTQYDWQSVGCPKFRAPESLGVVEGVVPAGYLVAVPGTGPALGGSFPWELTDGGLQPSGSGTGTSIGPRGPTGPTGAPGGVQPSGTGTSDGVRGVGYIQASIEAQRTRPLRQMR